MADETTAPEPRMPAVTPLGIFAWAAFLVGAALFIGLLAMARSRHESALGKWRDEMRPKREAAVAFGRRLTAMIPDLKSWAETERELGVTLAEGPKVHKENPNHRVGLVTDPASGFTFELRFYNDELRDVHARPAEGPPLRGWARGLDAVRLW